MRKFLLFAIAAMSYVCSFAAGKNDVNINISGSYTHRWTEETGDWFFGAKDDTEKYSVRLDYLTTKDGKYGSYTLKDLDLNYSCLYDYTSSPVARQYVEGTEFTISAQDGRMILNATLVCDNGVTYHVTANCAENTGAISFETSNFIDANYSAENDWYIRFMDEDENYRVTLDVISPTGEFEGTYTEADTDADIKVYNMITRLNDNATDHFVTFKYTFKLLEGCTHPRQGCEIHVQATGEYGDKYDLTYTFKPVEPSAKQDVSVKLTKTEWPSDKYYDGKGCYFELQQDNNRNMKWTLGMRNMMGTVKNYEIDKNYTSFTNSRKNVKLTYQCGTVVVTPDYSAGTIHVDAALVMSDGVEYTFSFDGKADMTLLDALSSGQLSPAVRKVLRGNRIVIENGDRCYDVNGAVSDR